MISLVGQIVLQRAEKVSTKSTAPLLGQLQGTTFQQSGKEAMC